MTLLSALEPSPKQACQLASILIGFIEKVVQSTSIVIKLLLPSACLEAANTHTAHSHCTLMDVLKSLESESNSLDVGPDERAAALRAVLQYAEEFLDSIAEAPAYVDRPLPDESILLGQVSENGIGLEQALQTLKADVDSRGINTTSGRFVGYIPGGGLFHSALADFLAAVTNRYSGVAFASPGAVRVEDQCLRWMAEMVDYPETFGGYLSAGGSMANFTAIVTARDAHEIEGEMIARSVVYMTEHAHHCLDKALHLAGLGKCPVRRIPVDEHFRMDSDALQKKVEEDVSHGLDPFLVVATAGTTNTGSVDPLKVIGEIAHKHGAWYHVDGAYGAFFALCDEATTILDGIQASDSIVMDPHKTLFLPYGTGALLVRDKKYLLAAHSMGADYMQDAINVPATSPATVSPELTKHFRGLRLWLPLQALGVAPFRAGLSEKLHLARYFHSRLSKISGWELGPEPDLSVVVYRFVPTTGNIDAFNERLVKAIHADGRIFVSSTRINGAYMLRLAAVCFRTHKADIDTIIKVLQELAASIELQDANRTI